MVLFLILLFNIWGFSLCNSSISFFIPKQFLKKIYRTGFGVHLFHEWRYTDYEGTKENSEFILNKPQYRNATVLLARDNFGCGSSREHAPWALVDYGFRVIVAPSFADIFYNNCIKNGLLLVRLLSDDIDHLFKQAEQTPGVEISADLENQVLIGPDKNEYNFEIDAFAKTCLLQGLDQIGWTKQFEERIIEFEIKLNKEKPWLINR